MFYTSFTNGAVIPGRSYPIGLSGYIVTGTECRKTSSTTHVVVKGRAVTSDLALGKENRRRVPIVPENGRDHRKTRQRIVI
jgi:hypothetical protein